MSTISFWRRFLDNVVAPTTPTGLQLLRLLTPFGRSTLVRRNAASVIVARVQLVSLLFAVLVPLFSVVDLLVFDGWQAAGLVATRFLAGGCFLALSYRCSDMSPRPYLRALSLLLCMSLIPPAFYLASVVILDPAGMSETQQLVAYLYTLMPTVVLGGLAIFPLSALEILVLALPVVGIAVAGLWLSGDAMSWAEHGAAFWFMGMAVGIAMFSGMGQAHYMNNLVHQAMTDPLTGVRTRRAGSEIITSLFAQAQRQGLPMAVLFCDIDHFKSINDTLGHDAGDRALVMLACSLRTGLRKSDVLVRWGGEEFLILLPGMRADGLDDYVASLARAGMGTREDGLPLTVSIGVAERMADGVADWESLVALADQRMYEAKSQGRARAVLPDARVVVFAETA